MVHLHRFVAAQPRHCRPCASGRRKSIHLGVPDRAWERGKPAAAAAGGLANLVPQAFKILIQVEVAPFHHLKHDAAVSEHAPERKGERY